MADKKFSHVCTACHAPVLRPGNPEPWSKFLLVVIGAVVAAAVLGNILQFMRVDSRFSLFVVLILPFLIVYFWRRGNLKKFRTCPSCAALELIPVGSPEGMRLMKQAGYVES